MLEFTREDLRKLIARQEQPCVSIYTPLHLEMPEAIRNPVPFKRLLSEAERQMVDAGYSASLAAKIVKPGRDLLADYGFWQQRSIGLAAFLSAYGFYRFRLPIAVTERLVINDRFYTKPLLPLMSGDGRFYILAFSQNEVRLLQATRYGEHRLDLKGIPANMQDALQYEKLERQLQYHTYANQEGGRTAIYHAQGGPQDEKKEDVAHFAEVLAKRVSARFGNESAPLLLAAVDYLQPMFRAHATYAHIVPEGLHGNPEALSDADLRAQAWTKVEPMLTKARSAALSKYNELKAGNLAARDPQKVIPAAQYGSVETLFCEVDTELWGTFEPNTNVLETHSSSQPGDIDLLDMAATQTLLNAGTVFALPREAMPDPSPITAVFRYPV